MCKLKLPFPLALPPRGNPARLPALLLPVLALAVVVQLALPTAPAAPAPGVVNRGVAAATPVIIGTVTAPQVLMRRNPFAPVTIGDGAAPAAGDPLEGAVIAGTVAQGHIRYALVQTPDGRITRQPQGGLIAGWRIVRLSDTAARLARGPVVMTVAYGQHAVPPTVSPTQSQSEDQQ